MTMNVIFIATLACMVALVYGNGRGMCMGRYCGTPPQTKEIINTTNEYKYIPSKFDFTKYKYVHFKVKACNDAHINLMADTAIDKHYTYEIVIGGWYNSQSVIRKWKQQIPPKATATGSYLNCNEFRTFWVSWNDNYIKVGTDSKEIMSFYDHSPYTVTGVSVSTGWGATGEWQIYNPNFDWFPKCCYSHGNRYCVVPDMGCKFYTQEDVTRYGSKVNLKNCIHLEGLQFNSYYRVCVCDHAQRTKCEV